MSEKKSRGRWVTVLLVGLPAWLLASAIFGLWFYFHHEKKLEEQSQIRFSQSISIRDLHDDLRKFVDVIGERNPSSPAAAASLSRISSMIQGTLGPGNTGYQVNVEHSPTEWPIIHVSTAGDSEEAAVWIIASYDSKPGSRGAEANASGLAATLAAAKELAGEKPARSIHFAFLPHANDPDSPVIETMDILFKLIIKTGEPSAVISVESMGAGRTLWITSRDTSATPLAFADDLGKVVGAEVACLGEDFDPASILFESGLPAVRVATRAMLEENEPDDGTPDAEIVAASAGRLVELIRRCARR